MPQLGDMPQLSLGKNTGQKIHLNIFKNQHKITKKKSVGPRAALEFVPLSLGKAAAAFGVCGKGRKILKKNPQKTPKSQ